VKSLPDSEDILATKPLDNNVCGIVDRNTQLLFWKQICQMSLNPTSGCHLDPVDYWMWETLHEVMCHKNSRPGAPKESGTQLLGHDQPKLDW